MAKFGSYCLIPNLMPQTPNISLHTTTVQDEDAVTAVELDIKIKNAKSQP